MSIKYAILGLLSWKPFTGYDLKKTFSGSSIFYWSGNNNQIYTTLLQLLKDGLATSEVDHRESGPARKTYTITEKGRAELREWVLQTPDAPDIRNSFLIRLAWADQLAPDDIDGILEAYEHEIEMYVLLLREKLRRGTQSPARTGREAFLWERIQQNVIASYEGELTWVRNLRRDLAEKWGAQQP